MHIVINTIPLLSRQTGIGTCIYNISKSLLAIDRVNKYTFYYGYFSNQLQKTPHDDVANVELTFNILQKAKPFIKTFPILSDVSKWMIEEWNKLISARKKIDVYFEPNYIPVAFKTRKIVTTVHDFSFYHHPEWHPRDRIRYFNKYFYKRIHTSDLIVTDSQFVRDEAREILKIGDSRLRVAHIGYDRDLFRPYPDAEVAEFKSKRQLPERFVLFVGSIEPRKNIGRLLRAYQSLPQALRQDFKLVLAGFAGWRNKDIMHLISQMQGQVIFLGYLTVRELALAYNAATVFAYPSLYEGFGLPPIEAMACGTPVLVSRIASLPEVCGEAAEYCDPLDVEDIAGKLEGLLTQESRRQELSARGQVHVTGFTWENTARKMMEIFAEVSR
jgi:glycosyltransferase involved in cell wall biosynthesis